MLDGTTPLSDGIDLQRPSAARVYDFFLGGSHNFAVDRAAAATAVLAMPELPAAMWANRHFMRRAVTVVAEYGIDQFIDLGSGIPTLGNVHEVARRVHPETRVVYVDLDPVAVVHSRSIVGDDPFSVVLQADLTNPEAVLGDPQVRRLIDFTRPVGLLLVAVAHFVPDTGTLIAALARYRDALVPGSCLVFSHASDEGVPDRAEQARQVYNQTTSPLVLRSRGEIGQLLQGWHVMEPGVTSSGRWRPDDGRPGDGQPGDAGADSIASRSVVVAVARKE